MLEELNSRGRTLVANVPSASTNASGDGDYADDIEDTFFLPTNGTSRVVRGTSCGGDNGSSCGSSTAAASPLESLQAASAGGTLPDVCCAWANCSRG